MMHRNWCEIGTRTGAVVSIKYHVHSQVNCSNTSKCNKLKFSFNCVPKSWSLVISASIIFFMKTYTHYTLWIASFDSFFIHVSVYNCCKSPLVLQDWRLKSHLIASPENTIISSQSAELLAMTGINEPRRLLVFQLIRWSAKGSNGKFSSQKNTLLQSRPLLHVLVLTCSKRWVVFLEQGAEVNDT